MNKLETGQVFKNYKTICKWLEVIPNTGSSKMAHIKEFERYCKYHREGQKYIIDEVYEVPLEKIDNRGNTKGESRYYKNFVNFKINKVDSKKYGVYKITKDNKIYIGSTIIGFRERFKQHLHGIQPSTKGLLDDGWIFEAMFITDCLDEESVREKEQYYIDKYLSDENWIVINRRSETFCVKTKNKTKSKIIKVDERQYDLAIKILKENGILINNKKVGVSYAS